MEGQRSSCSGLLRFMQFCGDLKRVRRTGWVRRGVRDVESVSDHMYRMAVMAMLFTSDLQSAEKRQVNREHCIKMALVHDLAECIVGDITPYDGISKEEKNRRETQAIQQITSSLPKSIADEVTSLWEEYEAGLTAEAELVKDLDKFEMILQAYEYEKADDRPGELQEFFDSTAGRIKHPVVDGWSQELRALRQRERNEVHSTDEDKSQQSSGAKKQRRN